MAVLRGGSVIHRWSTLLYREVRYTKRGRINRERKKEIERKRERRKGRKQYRKGKTEKEETE